ncbi:MAG: undecaprenyl/decaprenyl-phosphate alpha-N-acetylglucosaminyl 1-phosphate transferase [candidate division Zixibacteria bacterium]|nr:undecaprenyl/decaprenyl-phosphate alpha-N-acetylglucosaminyl 1-phosphate transferase [candidate division Zixibacteria bacterium]MBU2624223.1 undecaprenyl/decaprenyl-phosphate alpha-N-acetylglucosaminyl 1-phosphate transferase [candidate division Zixibacteria bacterium]
MSTYPLYFATALVGGVLLSMVSIQVCRRLGVFDMPTARKRHQMPMPHLGGAAIFISFWIVFAVAFQASATIQEELSGRLIVIFLASLVVFLTGLVDDLRNLSFVHKLLGQLVAAAIVMLGGFTIPMFHIPFSGAVELGWAAYPVTTLWIVVLSNSVNLIDGMDGLAGSVSLTVCFGMLLTGVLLEVESVVAITVCLAGAIVGFMFFNKPPAKLFMGDSGSLFLGFMFSMLAVICPIKSFTAVAMFVPLVAVGVPLTEVLVTFIRRSVTGQRFYVADNRHIYNYLLDYGFSQKTTLTILSGVSLAFTAFIPALFWFDRLKVFSIFATFILILFASSFVLKLKRSQGR